ncbi:hypothetical protein KP509_32G012200 [Ceratopteris richardii]|uniref:Uncharacterized protein n=1 Tax=Ceratopteris richardii TaxID=49495 RepID=A0A8T2QRD3_CERRI|nr:hypothetical protein KP509_32G012200 [Ceratopteris richardii]
MCSANFSSSPNGFCCSLCKEAISKAEKQNHCQREAHHRGTAHRMAVNGSCSSRKHACHHFPWSSPTSSAWPVSAASQQSISPQASSVPRACLCSPTTHTGSFKCRLHRRT